MSQCIYNFRYSLTITALYWYHTGSFKCTMWVDISFFHKLTTLFALTGPLRTPRALPSRKSWTYEQTHGPTHPHTDSHTALALYILDWRYHHITIPTRCPLRWVGRVAKIKSAICVSDRRPYGPRAQHDAIAQKLDRRTHRQPSLRPSRGFYIIGITYILIRT